MIAKFISRINGKSKLIRHGFTNLEMLMAIGIIGIIFGIAAPVFRQYQIKNALDTSTSVVMQFLMGAQTYAQSGKNDSTWGVYVPDSTLFAGEDFDQRDINQDVSFKLPSGISVEGLQEITFSRLDGIPSETGTIRIISNANGSYREVTVDENGVISIQNPKHAP